MHLGVKASKGDSTALPMTELVGQVLELEEQMKKTTHHNFVTVLKEVAYINLVSLDGQTALHIAARLMNSKHPEHPSSIMEYLLNHPKIMINIQDSHGRTPLHFAVIYNCIGNAKYLIEYGANLDIPDIYGAIPLHYACRCLENNNVIDLFLNFTQLFNRETHDKKKPIDIMI
ncbi:unnamed protein product, partial [Adineta steineri]